MFEIHDEIPGDAQARENLLDRAFGLDRFAKTCERLREGRLPAEGLALIARHSDEVVGTIRFWHVNAGRKAALLLGPVAVETDYRSFGLGAALIRTGLARAAERGHEAVILVGDAPYYQRFGFSGEKVGALWLPGPYDPARFLALELKAGALHGARGLVRPTGIHEPAADLGSLVAAAANDERPLRPWAA